MKKIHKYWSKFKYLGYDKQTIEDVRLKLDEDNIRITERVSLILICILVIILAFYSVFDPNFVRNCICFTAIFMMLGICLISKAMLAKKFVYTKVQVDIMIDALSFACFIIAIYLGTFAVGDELAVAPVWMFFFAVLVYNRLPIQNLVVVLCALTVFTICCYITKSPRIFQYDMMHAVTSIFASFTMSWDKSRMKVENIRAVEILRNANTEILETVEEREKETNLLRHKVGRDELTGFYKKITFEEKVRGILNGSNQQSTHAFACIDIDDFKSVNDKFGHLYGDKVLKEIAAAIEEQTNEKALLSRFGGDEFCIFFQDILSEYRVENCIMNILEHGHLECKNEDISQWVTLSIGVAVCKGSDVVYHDVFQRADDALYRAKNEGKNTYRIISG